MLDRWGNPTIEPPKTPRKVLPTQTPDNVHRLIDAAVCLRDKAIISLLADSGARRGEAVNIKPSDVDWQRSRIKVLGKGNKEGYLIFGDATKRLLQEYVAQAQPDGTLFRFNAQGLKTMLRRLEERTGIKCNPHTFRRGFATELRRQGVGELDIMELGRWSSVDMVRRYTRAYTFEDAAKRYKPIVS